MENSRSQFTYYKIQIVNLLTLVISAFRWSKVHFVEDEEEGSWT